jgi:release factor glutamine methyltransferase
MLTGNLIERFKQTLSPLMGENEAAAVTFRVMEEVLSLRRMDLVFRHHENVAPGKVDELLLILKRLEVGEPVQYVLGTAPFLGRNFIVNKNVLVPRPETEELVLWILDDTSSVPKGRLLEPCTGSGCMAITLALERPQWEVCAFDVSEGALDVARINAERNSATLRLHHIDLFDMDSIDYISSARWDIMACNPPYIPFADASTLAPAVLQHEPHLALFEPDNEPLKFYRALGELAMKSLRPGGSLYVEVHENHADATAKLFLDYGLTGVIIRRDIFDKPRMIKAVRPEIK